MNPMNEPQPTTRCWRIVRRALFLLIGFITLAALVITEENWRGKRDWEKFKSEGEARGERFDLASFTPKPVPTEQNFYATPFLAPLLDYEIVNGEARWHDSNGVARAKSLGIVSGALMDVEKGNLTNAQKYLRASTNFPARPQPQDPAGDILFALQKFEPIMLELRAASERPAAVFSTHPDRDLSAQLTHFIVIKEIAQTADLHALASLAAGNSADALADVRLIFGVGQVLKSEPTLIAHLVRIAILNVALQPARHGLETHRWSDEQLQALQSLFLSDDLLADYGQVLRGERAFGNAIMAQYIAGNYGVMGAQNPGFKFLGWFSPRGLLYQNQLAGNRLFETYSAGLVDATEHRVYPERCTTNAFEAALGRHTPYNIFTRMTFPAMQRIPILFAYTQNKFDEAVVACALERYRLAHGKFPENLEALAPQFITKIPSDVIGGQPLRYRCTETNQFVLYSIGWNEKDDGGVSKIKGGREDRESGDWVWQAPAK